MTAANPLNNHGISNDGSPDRSTFHSNILVQVEVRVTAKTFVRFSESESLYSGDSSPVYEPRTGVIGNEANCHVIHACLGPNGNGVPPDRVHKVEVLASRSSDDIEYVLQVTINPTVGTEVFSRPR